MKRRRVVASMFSLTLLCCTVSVAQPLFKVGVYENGDYTLLQDPDGSDGHTITALLLRATGDQDAIEAAEVLEQSIQLRRNGNEAEADRLQGVWDKKMDSLGAKAKGLPIQNPFVLSVKNLLVQLGKAREE